MASREHRLRVLENLAKRDARPQERDPQMKIPLIVEVAHLPAKNRLIRRKRTGTAAPQPGLKV